MEELHIKEAESVVLDCFITDGDVSVLNLDSVILKVDVRRLSGEHLTNLRVDVLVAELGRFRAHLDGYPLFAGTYLVDLLIESASNGLKINSETFKLVVNKTITHLRA